MSQGGRHGHTIRRLRRRMDAVLEEDRRRRMPPPPPISEEHAALRSRIEQGLGSLLDPKDPESTDLEKRIAENHELVNAAAECLRLMRQEQELLASHDVDYQLYDRYQPLFQGRLVSEPRRSS